MKELNEDNMKKRSKMWVGVGNLEAALLVIVHLAQQVTLEQRCRVVIDYDPEDATEITTWVDKDAHISPDQEIWRQMAFVDSKLPDEPETPDSQRQNNIPTRSGQPHQSAPTADREGVPIDQDKTNS